MSAATVRLEPVTDAVWLQQFIVDHWGAPGIVTRGRLWTGDDLTAIRAVDGNEVVGLASWRADPADWEIVSVDSLRRGERIGTRLLDAAVELARRSGAQRAWLVTTNDNLDALRFCQKRGWRLAAVHSGAAAESRKIKPSIPQTGNYGIPVRDEIELEYAL